MDGKIVSYRNYSMDDLYIGMQESFTVRMTEGKQKGFTEISGDINPLHIDPEYAKECGYRECVVYGMCTASFYSTLAGVYLPGKRCLLHECSIQWTKPVYVGDLLTVNGEISDINIRFNRITIKATIRNQNNEKVSRAKIIAGVIQGGS